MHYIESNTTIFVTHLYTYCIQTVQWLNYDALHRMPPVILKQF